MININTTWFVLFSIMVVVTVFVFQPKLQSSPQPYSQLSYITPLSTLEQQNTLDEWYDFELYRAILELRFGAFLMKAGILYEVMDETLATSIIRDAQLKRDMIQFANSPQLLSSLDEAVNLLGTAFRMYEDFDTYNVGSGYKAEDLADGADALFVNMLTALDKNFYIFFPEFQSNVEQLDSTRWPIMRDLFLANFQDILYAATVDLNDNLDYARQVELLTANATWNILLNIELFNFMFSFIPPANTSEYEEIIQLLVNAISTLERFNNIDTWLTPTQFAQVLVEYPYFLNGIRDVIESRWGILPSENVYTLAEGTFILDEFGILRRADFEPFYVLNADGSFSQSTMEDWEAEKQLYKLVEGQYIPLDEIDPLE